MSEIKQYVLDWTRLRVSRDDPDVFPLYARVMRQKKNLTRTEMAVQAQIGIDTLLAIENGLVLYEDIPMVDLQNLERCLGLSYRNFREQYNVLPKEMLEGKLEGVE